MQWEDVMKLGEEQSDDELNARLKRIAVNQCCTLVYTVSIFKLFYTKFHMIVFFFYQLQSGTTGNPKGVMLSHDNLSWDALAIGSYLKLKTGQEEIVSYLPLSHVAAQVNYKLLQKVLCF
jgi:long-chain-fatty-acid--CoA ligase ACSBG